MKVKIETLERHTVTLTAGEITTLEKCCNLLQKLHELVPVDEDIDEAFYYMNNILDSISSNSIFLAEYIVKEETEDKEVL